MGDFRSIPQASLQPKKPPSAARERRRGADMVDAPNKLRPKPPPDYVPVGSFAATLLNVALALVPIA